MKTPPILYDAIRQYRHNDDNSPDLFNPEKGFAFGFDIAKTIKAVESLNEQIAQLQARLESEEAHYARLVEQHKSILDEAIEWIQDDWPFSKEQILESLNG